jgi:ubiquinone/menaquinone biosynthesis C-methylase UbiE
VIPDDDLQEERDRLLDNWDAAAKGWGRQADRTRESALPVSEWMIAHAGLAPGQLVLELAAGPGDTGFMAAERILPGGTLISSDGSAAMLEVAEERAAEQGVTNVEFKQLQLEWIDMEAASVDVILCRWGVMLTVDPAAALRECRRVLKPGGRCVLAVWDLAENNPFAVIPNSALVALGHAEPPTAGGPGMFALSEPGLLAEMLADAGFFDVEVEPMAISEYYVSVLDWIGQTRDRSQGFAKLWDQFSDAQRQELRGQMAEAAGAFADGDGGFDVPGSVLAAVASA